MLNQLFRNDLETYDLENFLRHSDKYDKYCLLLPPQLTYLISTTLNL